MTNFQAWQVYMKSATSPQVWIDFGYYFMIGAALQRRVWLYGAGDDGSELFPNPYMCFVGRPGLGKGLVTRPVSSLLRHHKMELGSLIKTNIGTEKPPLFPTGADSITFEQLLDDIADSIRPISRPGNPKPYIHSSFFFVLEELDSLFKRKTADVVSFLKNAYDCGSYEYKTRHQAKHLMRNLCLALLAGTQPDFFLSAQKQGLFGEGFSSRTLWLFANEKRFSKFHNTEVDEEQKAAKAILLSWIKKLSLLYGPVTYPQDVKDYLEHWELRIHSPAELQAHPRMQEYMARKKVIMLKLAMAKHFSESTAMTMTLPVFIDALDTLTALEPALEAGLGCSGRNPLFQFHAKVIAHLEARKAVGERELILLFIQDLEPEQTRSILATLLETKQIKSHQEKGQNVYHL